MAIPFDQLHLDKQLLMRRLKDLKFVDDVSEFQCKRCGQVLIQHYVANCGHAFCSNCKKLLGDGSERWKCTECQEFVVEIDVQDVELERKMFNLRVHCANTNYGCSFSCALKDLSEHLKVCEFTRENALPVLCDNRNTTEAILEQIVEINKKFYKLNLDIECINQKLDKTESKQNAFDNKLEKINRRINDVNSDLKVEKTKTNNEINKLKSKLEKEMEKINITKTDANLGPNDMDKYEHLNKTVTKTTKNITEKLKAMEDTMKLINPQIIHLESYINMIKLQVNPMSLKDAFLKRPADFVWELNDIKNQFKQNGVTVKSQWFPLNDYPLEAQASVYYSSEEMTMSVWFKESNNADSSLQMMKLKPSIYLIIRNQVDDRDWDVIRCSKKGFRSPLYSEYSFEAIDKSLVTRAFGKYIKNDALLLEAHVEPPETCNHVFSYDGNLSWAIKNYKKNKEIEAYKYVTFHESPYFYTAPNGYRVQARVCLNYYPNGKFDDEIKDEISHKITVTVINQKNPNGNLSKSEMCDPGVKHSWFNQKCGGFKMTFAIKEIESVVSNDTLYYQVKVETM